MTARERLLTVLRRGQPDRVPVTIYEMSVYNDDWANREPSYAALLELEQRWGDTLVYTPTNCPVLLPTSAPFMLPLSPRCLRNAEIMYRTAQDYGRYAC